ncbi:MAG: DUF2892 domain-containing protein [Nanoarchaeota archaeon]|nr:DUF2892 domain-containing protein [Nanoarchaeota archaeon]
MKKNLSKCEMVTRVLMGILIIVALYLPSGKDILLWVVAGILIITGLLGTCMLCKILKIK